MARRQLVEENLNHDRWLVSYADFITLLFAFFVVMYSVSSVNEGKYRILSESLNAAFRAPATSLDPVQIGAVSRTSYTRIKQKRLSPITLDFEGLPQPRSFKAVEKPPKKPVVKPEQPVQPMKKLHNQIKKLMSPLEKKGLVQIRGNNLKLEIEIKSSILFESGSASMSPSASPILQKLARFIKPLANNVQVEGFTDDIPIHNTIFPSNWELSAARSASVVQAFVGYGVDPKRLAATGYSKYQPIADNQTEEGRRKNRRVVLSIKATKYDEGMMESISGFGVPGGLRSPGSRTILVDPIYEEIKDLDISPARDNVPARESKSESRITPSRILDYQPLTQEPGVDNPPVPVAPSSKPIPDSERSLPDDELPVKSGSFSVIRAPANLQTQQGKSYTSDKDLKKEPVSRPEPRSVPRGNNQQIQGFSSEPRRTGNDENQLQQAGGIIAPPIDLPLGREVVIPEIQGRQIQEAQQ